MTRQRVTRAWVGELRRDLGERDLAVVATLARVRVATGDQLRRLHFTTGTPATNARVCQRVLTRLMHRRVLCRLDRRIGGVRAGSGGFVYALDAAGQRLATGNGPAGGQRVRRPWSPSVLYMAHMLAVTALYVRLVEGDRENLVELLTFEAEPASWRRFLGRGGGWTVLKPDAYVRTGLGAFEDHWFVEVDLDTESPAALARKLALYRQYWATGREQARHGDVFPQVLFLVPAERRMQQLIDVIGGQPPEVWRLFRVVRFDQTMDVFTGELGGENGAEASNPPYP